MELNPLKKEFISFFFLAIALPKEVSKSKAMFTFNTKLNAYQLVIPQSEHDKTCNWLLKEGCEFDRYFRVSQQEVKLTFIRIPAKVVELMNSNRFARERF